MEQEDEKSQCVICWEDCRTSGNFVCPKCSRRSHEPCWFEWIFKSTDSVIKCQGCITVLEHVKPFRRQIIDAVNLFIGRNFFQSVEELDQLWIHLMPLLDVMNEGLDNLPEAALFVRALRLWSHFLAESTDDNLKTGAGTWMLRVWQSSTEVDVLLHPVVQHLVRIARRSQVLEGCPLAELPSLELQGGASCFLGCLYSDEKSPDLNMPLAAALFKRSADEGHPTAIFGLATTLERRARHFARGFIKNEAKLQEVSADLAELCESPHFQVQLEVLQAGERPLLLEGTKSLLVGLRLAAAPRLPKDLPFPKFEAFHEHCAEDQLCILALLAWEACPQKAALLPVVAHHLQNGEAAARFRLGKVYCDERLWCGYEIWSFDPFFEEEDCTDMGPSFQDQRARLERAADLFQHAARHVPDATFDLVSVLMDMALLEGKQVAKQHSELDMTRVLEQLEKVISHETWLLDENLDHKKQAKATRDFLLAFFLRELSESHGWTGSPEQDLWQRVDTLRASSDLERSVTVAACLAWVVNPRRALGHRILRGVLKLDQVVDLLFCDSTWYLFLSHITGGNHHLWEAISHCATLPLEAASRTWVAQEMLRKAAKMFQKEKAADCQNLLQNFLKLTSPAAKACGLTGPCTHDEHLFLCAVLKGHYLMGQLQDATRSPEAFLWEVEEKKVKQLLSFPAGLNPIVSFNPNGWGGGAAEDQRLELCILAAIAWGRRPSEVQELPAAAAVLGVTDGHLGRFGLDLLAGLLTAPPPVISELLDLGRAEELYREMKALPDLNRSFCVWHAQLHRALRLLQVSSSYLEGRQLINFLFGPFPESALSVPDDVVFELGDFTEVENLLWEYVDQGSRSAVRFAWHWLQPMLRKAVDLFRKDSLQECQEHLQRCLTIAGPRVKHILNYWETGEDGIDCGYYIGLYLMGRCEAAGRALGAFDWDSERRRAEQLLADGLLEKMPSLRTLAALAWTQRPAAVPAFLGEERYAGQLLARTFAGARPETSEFLDQKVAEQWYEAARQAPGEDDGYDLHYFFRVLVEKALRLFKEKSLLQCQACIAELMALRRDHFAALDGQHDLWVAITRDLLLGRYLAHLTAHPDVHLAEQRLTFLLEPPQRVHQFNEHHGFLAALVWDVDEELARSLPRGWLLGLEHRDSETCLRLLSIFLREPTFRDMERAMVQLARLGADARALVRAATTLWNSACAEFQEKSLDMCKESLTLLRHIEELLVDENLEFEDLRWFLQGSWLAKEVHRAEEAAGDFDWEQALKTMSFLHGWCPITLMRAFYGTESKFILRAKPQRFISGAENFIHGSMRGSLDPSSVSCFKCSSEEGHPLAVFVLACQLQRAAHLHLETSSFDDCRQCLDELRLLAEHPQFLSELKPDVARASGCKALLLGLYMSQLLQEVEASPSTLHSALTQLKWLGKDEQPRLHVLAALAWNALPETAAPLPQVRDFLQLQRTEAMAHCDLGRIFGNSWKSLDLFHFKDLEKAKAHLLRARDGVPLAGFHLACVLQEEASVLFYEQNSQKWLQTLEELCDLGFSLQAQEEFDEGGPRSHIYIQGAEALLLAECFVALSSTTLPEAFDWPLASKRWSWLQSSKTPMTKLQALAALAWGMKPQRLRELPLAVQILKLQEGTAKADHLAGLLHSCQDRDSNPFYDLRKAGEHFRQAAEARLLLGKELATVDSEQRPQGAQAPDGRVVGRAELASSDEVDGISRSCLAPVDGEPATPPASSCPAEPQLSGSGTSCEVQTPIPTASSSSDVAEPHAAGGSLEPEPIVPTASSSQPHAQGSSLAAPAASQTQPHPQGMAPVPLDPAVPPAATSSGAAVPSTGAGEEPFIVLPGTEDDLEDLADVEDPDVQHAAWQSLQEQNPVAAVMRDPVQMREQQRVLCHYAREEPVVQPTNVPLFLLQFQRHSKEFQRRLHEGSELEQCRAALTAAGHEWVLKDFFQVKVFVHPSQYTAAVRLLQQHCAGRGLFPRHVVVTETFLELLLGGLRGCPGAKEKSRVLLGEVAPPPPESEDSSEPPRARTTEDLLQSFGLRCLCPEVRTLTELRPKKKCGVVKSSDGASLRGCQADFEVFGLAEPQDEDGLPGRPRSPGLALSSRR